MPESGKIHIVKGGVVRPKDLVLEECQKTLFLRREHDPDYEEIGRFATRVEAKAFLHDFEPS